VRLKRRILGDEVQFDVVRSVLMKRKDACVRRCYLKLSSRQ
jgi:hypothetical protein